MKARSVDAGKWMSNCRIGTLEQGSAPSQAELNQYTGPPSFKGGTVSVIKGTLKCVRPGDTQLSEINISVFLKDDLVAVLTLGR
jgi:hypothetical protein